MSEFQRPAVAYGLILGPCLMTMAVFASIHRLKNGEWGLNSHTYSIIEKFYVGIADLVFLILAMGIFSVVAYEFGHLLLTGRSGIEIEMVEALKFEVKT